MNKRGWYVILLIFLVMYAFNSMTPLLNEDYFGAFIWPEGIPNLGKLPEDAERISGLTDVLENLRVYYFSEGGRLPGCFIVGVLFWDLGKAYFNPVNALLMTFLVVEMYWLIHEGKVTFTFEHSYLIWIFFSLWSFNASFVDTCLWMSGASNYLWMMVAVLAFLLPYVNNYYDYKSLAKDSPMSTIGMFLAGILAGWSHETTTCWLILILLYWLYVCRKRNELQDWKVAGVLGVCIGYALLMFAPGNFARLAVQQQANSVVSFTELYSYKFNEIIWIMLFHFFLWYYIIRAFFICKEKRKQNKVVGLYFIFALMSSIIAFGSGVLMFLIPASTWRVSFLNLVFLTVAAASLFKMQEVTRVSIIPEKVKSFFKIVASFYLFITIVVSLWCNYINFSHWNAIVAKIQQEIQQPTNTVLHVQPYFTDKKPLLQAFSGFHLIYMPIVYGDENNRINAIVAKYYGIKGISKEK